MKTLWVKCFTLLIVVLALFGCEGQTTYSKEISNHTNDTLVFKIYTNYPGLLIDSFIVLPNQPHLFWNWSKLGGSDTYAPCNDGIDSIYFFTSDSAVLIKEFLDNNNWEYTRNANKRGSMVDNYCTFHIYPADLEK